MDLPGHILEAVQTASDASHPPAVPRRIRPAHHPTRDASRKPSLPTLRTASSSVEDISSDPDSDQDHGYQTDFTSQPSEACPDELHVEEMEEWRAREYPQLKGKTYLDHGGATVRSPLPAPYSHHLTDPFPSAAVRAIPHRRVLRRPHLEPVWKSPLGLVPICRLRAPRRRNSRAHLTLLWRRPP